MNNIITEQDIVNTYNEKQQEQYNLYLKYLEIKKLNPTFGHKRIATLLEQPYGKTRFWHAKNQTPVPVQTINWLKEKQLIPLSSTNSKLSLIAKILGTTFGDGGIFENLNGIFLSSSELRTVKEFGKDLKIVFGSKIEENSRVIEGGVYGHSWCYQNTNRKVIRFFKALGSPTGRKSEINLMIPKWIYKDQKLQDSFFSSFFGNEIGIPKIHRDNKRTNSLDIGLVCKKELYPNRIEFLKQVQNYLNSRNVKADKIYTRQHKDDKHSFLIKLSISLNFDNLMNFYKNIKISYSKNKQEKLIGTLTSLKKIKLQRFNKLSSTINKLTQRAYSREWIKNNLRLTERSLSFILDQKTIEKWN